jgi:hypothetical protein
LLDRSEVDALLDAQALAESLGAMATAAILDVEIAAGYGSTHNPEAEERHGRSAVRRGTELGLGLVAAYGWHHVAAVAAVRGDRDQFEAAAAAARVAAPGNRDIDGMLVGACEVYAALMTDDIERALAGAQRCADLLRGSETAPPMHARAAWPLLLAVNRRSEAPAAIEELERAGLAVSRAGRGTLLMARAVMAARADRVRAGELAVQADELLVDVPLAVRRTSARRRGGGGGRLDDPRCLDDRGRGVAARSRLPRPG